VLSVKEEFLHYLWKYSLYYSHSLKDKDGNQIEVINPGIYNRDSGPDFFNARIRIDGTEWAGNVEIHTKSSHFVAHGHHRDHAYDNLILHAVYEKDSEVHNARGEEILTVAIDFDRSLTEKYLSIVNNPYIIACQDDILKTDRFYLQHWLHSLVIERLVEKTNEIERILKETGNDWEETFYRILSRYFGFRINTEPFEMLASAIPFRIIRKHMDNRFQVEALLFGTAGMLEEGLFREAIADSYYSDLVREFKVFSSKYSIIPVHGWLWKFGRLRPFNFPTIRISQLAAMLTIAGGLFSVITETSDLRSLRKVFEVSAADYWDNHYIFGRESKPVKKKTGETATDIMLINAVIPVLFAYGRIRDDRMITERAVSFMEEIHPESNSVIDEWKSVGVESVSAFETQALLQLRNEYCRKRRCLDCRIGARLISKGVQLKNDHELILEPEI
jgi:hypothetical protein